MFGTKTTTMAEGRLLEFSYLSKQDIYLDNACQSLRPLPVIEAVKDYYLKNNACGDRVKYRWGQQVDELVEATRLSILKFLNLSKKDYVCSFALNTTSGINAVLSQLPKQRFSTVITSDIEHNSVFLPTIELSKRLSVIRMVLPRQDDGALIYNPQDLKNAVVVLNAVSNIDGRRLANLSQLVKDVHNQGGIIIIDAAQAMANYHDMLKNCGADAICFSGHKMYAPSIGVVVIRKELLACLEIKFVGGGMVYSVKEQTYELLPDEPHAWLEPGLQPYAEIIGLKQAVAWLESVRVNGNEPAKYINNLAGNLFSKLQEINSIELFNNRPSSAISIYPKKGDSHRLAIFLSSAGIMARSGTFCCHYFLNEKIKSPPLLRLSLGLNNNLEDIEKVVETIKRVTKG